MVFDVWYCRNVFVRLRSLLDLKVCKGIKDKEHMVDTRGSGFSWKAASLISMIFGSLHLSLMSTSNEDQSTAYSTEKEVEVMHQSPRVKVVGRRSVVKDDGKQSYATQLLKEAVELSLLSLLKSATLKVERALSGYRFNDQLSLGLGSSIVNKNVFDDEQVSGAYLTRLDGLVKNADARREINKVLNVVNIGRQEVETRDHPLLVVAEATAFYLKRQIDFLEQKL